MAAAAAVIGFSAIYSAKSAHDAAKHNAAMGRQNAQIARQNAIDQAKQQARENYLRLGDMQAAIGKSGGSGGSFLDVLADSAGQMELQRQQVLYAGLTKASMLESGASLSDAEAHNALIGGVLKASGALIGGSGSVSRQGSQATLGEY